MVGNHSLKLNGYSPNVRSRSSNYRLLFYRQFWCGKFVEISTQGLTDSLTNWHTTYWGHRRGHGLKMRLVTARRLRLYGQTPHIHNLILSCNIGTAYPCTDHCLFSAYSYQIHIDRYLDWRLWLIHKVRELSINYWFCCY